MGYTETFGGELIFPSQTSYLAITTLVDVTLQWPIEQQIAGIDVVADFMDVDTGIGLNIDMPDARQASTGQKTLFNNVGANTYTVRDAVGGTIQTVAIGEQWVFTLTDNTTEAGTWLVFQMGSTVSVATAGPLAGFGIKAISATLNQMIESDVEASTPFTVVDGDRARCLIYTTGTGTCNLPSPAAVGDDWFFMLRNSGTGTLNIVPPSGVIDDAASINLDPNDSCFIFTDGTDFFTVGLSTGSVIAFDFVSIAIAGSGDFTLSGANLNRISYRFTGLLTGDRKIVVPGTTQQYWVDNQTTGAFALTVGTSAQVGEPEITQGLAEIFYCDGVDVINAVSAVAVSVPVTIAQGGTNATTVGGAQTSLQVPPTSRDMIAGVAMSGGGTLAADRTFDYAGGLDDQSDVTLTAPATGSVLFKSAADWLNTPAIQIDPLDSVDLQFNGATVFRTLLQGIEVIGDGADTVSIQLLDSGLVLVAQIDLVASQWLIENRVNASDIRIQGRDAAGNVSSFLLLDPDVNVQISHPAEGATGTVVARTLASTAGGLEANNALTGGGFERVLTTADISATFATFISSLTALSGNVDTVITQLHSLGGIPDIIQLVLECTTGEHGYSIGDQIIMNPGESEVDEGASVAQSWNLLAADADEIFSVIGSEVGFGVSIPDRSTPGQFAQATVGSWSFLVKAIRF